MFHVNVSQCSHMAMVHTRETIEHFIKLISFF